MSKTIDKVLLKKIERCVECGASMGFSQSFVHMYDTSLCPLSAVFACFRCYDCTV